MAKKIVAGNWKMNTNPEAGIALFKTIQSADIPQDVEVIIGAPFTHLHGMMGTSNGKVQVAAQNCHTHESGAFTGEISAGMLQSIGVSHVILGHSERRTYFKEDDVWLKEKCQAALKARLKPIYCCGEVLDQRNQGIQNQVVEDQIEKGLFDLSAEEIVNCIIAYEPVWAIGTGVTATPDQAQEMHAHIRSLLTKKFGVEIAQSISILYGGSVKPANSQELFSKMDVDGGLIGGASLKSDDFIQIIHSY